MTGRWADDAACADPDHRLLWLACREEHLDRHPTSDKWDNYWWDLDTPDIRYAVTVCNHCPVIDQCKNSRPLGFGGVWGGKYFYGRTSNGKEWKRTRTPFPQ